MVVKIRVSKDIFVKLMDSDEVLDVSNLWLQFLRETTALSDENDRKKILDDGITLFEKVLASGNDVLVLRYRNAVVGFSIIGMEENAGIISSIYIMPVYRGIGLGGLLLSESESSLGSLGASIIIATSLSQTSSVFFRTHGYLQIDEDIMMKQMNKYNAA